jgi:two-component system, cell cycle response regulator CpdR
VTQREDAIRTVVLIVDDDPEVREILAEFLTDFGHRVLQASGGTEALDLLARQPDIKLVITDVRMPDISGIELADMATRTRPDLKVILISGFFVSQKTGRRVLRKPFRMKELQDAIQAELAT